MPKPISVCMRISGGTTRNQPKNRFKARKKAFLHFLPYLMTFQSSTTTSVRSTFKKPSNMAKNEEKPCSTYLKPISLLHFHNPKVAKFWIPDPSLMTSWHLGTMYILLISANNVGFDLGRVEGISTWERPIPLCQEACFEK